MFKISLFSSSLGFSFVSIPLLLHPSLYIVMPFKSFFQAFTYISYTSSIVASFGRFIVDDIEASIFFCHAPCMARREAFEAVGGYTDDPKFLRVEDYDLWVKIDAAGYRGMNLEEPLYQMRDDRDAYSRRKFRFRLNEARVIRKAIRLLKLPKWQYYRALRPILVGLMPMWLYKSLHKKRLGGQEQ